MSQEITFYHNPESRGRIAHWMLEEVGAPYRVELLSFDRSEHKRPEYLRINPMGKIPAIVHRGTVVTEAAAICAYLADAFPDKQLAPGVGDPQRGSYYRWLFFGAGCIEPALAEKAYPRKEPATSRALAWGSYQDTVQTLEGLLRERPYVLGDRFSAADVYVGSCVGWGLFSKGFEPLPAFQSYVERLNQRPAFQRMVAQCNAPSKQLKEA